MLPIIIAALLFLINHWRDNPTNLNLLAYFPKPMPKSPALVLAQHSEENNYTAYADEKGFIALFPSTTNVWHGTADDFVGYSNLAETLKQWSAIMEVPFTRNVTDSPEPGYTRIVYGNGKELLGYSASGIGHTVPCHVEVRLEWFGLQA
ncbi:hypothetical protein F4679DRAFT_578126 [Xylaria curta]|nr:hypothetical protein F4679DRAFT_578126 [Xylaria curta]